MCRGHKYMCLIVISIYKCILQETLYISGSLYSLVKPFYMLESWTHLAACIMVTLQDFLIYLPCLVVIYPFFHSNAIWCCSTNFYDNLPIKSISVTMFFFFIFVFFRFHCTLFFVCQVLRVCTYNDESTFLAWHDNII